jgi:hypothetical protein
MPKLLAAVVAGVLACSMPSVVVAETDEATAEALMRDSGIWKELGEVSGQVHASLARALAEGQQQHETAILARMETAVDQAYAPERLRTSAKEIILQEMEEAHLPAIREWYESDIGTTIANIEDSAPADKESRVKLTETGAALLKDTLPSRRALLETILTASRAVEVTSRITINSTVAALRAVARANPEAPIPSEQKLRSQLDEARSRIEQALSVEFLQVCASMYAEVPDTKLREYGKFLDSPAGQHLSTTLANAIDAALRDGAKRLGREIVPSKGLAA